MQDLFSAKEAALSPLADRMRPRTLDEFIWARAHRRAGTGCSAAPSRPTA